jgi:L-threonylcarbamoyladenylate synthase
MMRPLEFARALRKTAYVKTLLTRVPAEAAKFIKNGGIAAFPTETVYGLGADVFDEIAIAKIFEAKQRPADNPLIAHVGSIEQIDSLTIKIPETGRKFIDVFFPGPLTIVLRKSPQIPMIATAGLETIGVRMPRHELAREFLKACETPVVAPSANISGRPSPTTWEAVYEDLNGRIDCILQGEATEIGLESTIVGCTGDVPIVLRSGAISIEQLRQVVAETEVYSFSNDDPPRSPGMKHRHYSPNAKVSLIDADSEADDSRVSAYIGIHRPASQFRITKICDSVEQYAQSLFEFFRECDRNGIVHIYCETVSNDGIGLALMDRLMRASE